MTFLIQTCGLKSYYVKTEMMRDVMFFVHNKQEVALCIIN